MTHHILSTPIGKLTVSDDSGSISRLYFENQPQPVGEYAITPLLQEAEEQLSAYFEGKRKDFSLPFKHGGTVFMQAVWERLTAIEYGKELTYKDIAQAVGSPKAARAVGNACNRNPLPIFIPCHRVVGTSGNLTGFAGGLDIKRFLLDLEKANA